MTDPDEPREQSPTAHILDELQLYGFRPFHDEPDPRPLPEGDRGAGAVADIFDALIGTLADTRLEPDLDDLLWSTVNLFHRAAERVDANSTTTSRHSVDRSANKTAQRWHRSNLSDCWPKA